MAVLHHLAVGFMRIKSTRCRWPSVKRRKVLHKFYGLTFHGQDSEIQKVPNLPQFSTDSWTQSMGVEASLWTVSSFSCSRTEKQIFPGPIKVISYSHAAVLLSRVSGLQAAIYLSAEKKWVKCVLTQRQQGTRDMWGQRMDAWGLNLQKKTEPEKI